MVLPVSARSTPIPRLRLAGALACTVAAVLLHLAIPLILKRVVDDGLDPDNPGFVYVAGTRCWLA